MKVVLIIPTYQAERYIEKLMNAVFRQTRLPDEVCCIDSSSTDRTVELLKTYPVTVRVIPKKEFNHGGTRQKALSWVSADLYIYLTQDAILADDNALKHLIECFNDARVGSAYGRQLPHEDANLLGAHLREFNYPAHSEVRSIHDVRRLGIRTCHNSNSFAAYRASALNKVGGFPNSVILGEDVYIAARLLQAGYHIAYCAEAKVYHSHNYTLRQDFGRYFDIGVFHAQNLWILEQFRSPDRLGCRYLFAELGYCLKRLALGFACRSLAHTVVKWIGYRLGRRYRCLSVKLCRCFSMHKTYWS